VSSGRNLCVGLIAHPEESYRLWRVHFVWSRNLKNEEALVCVWPQRRGEKSLNKYFGTTNLCIVCVLSMTTGIKKRQ